MSSTIPLKSKQSSKPNTENKIAQLLAMRETQRGLKDRLKLMDEAVGKLESELIAAADSGLDLSSSGYEVTIHELVRRYPAWKEHFIEHCGKAAADVVLEATAATVHRKLVIK